MYDVIRTAADALKAIRLESRNQRRAAAVRMPSPDALRRAIAALSAALYPRRLGSFHGDADAEDAFVQRRIESGLAILQEEVAAELAYWQLESEQPFDHDHAATIVRHFAATLADIRVLTDGDLDAAFIGDPAARSLDEILVSYPARSRRSTTASRTNCSTWAR